MSSGNKQTSTRGPLPRFGGPASKAYFKCKICEQEIRKDSIKKHYDTHISIEVLNKPATVRRNSRSRIISRRKLWFRSSERL